MQIESIGAFVKHQRLHLGIEQQQFAGRICVSQSCLSRWENGSRQIPCEAIPEIAKRLGCPELIELKLQECPLWIQKRPHQIVA